MIPEPVFRYIKLGYHVEAVIYDYLLVNTVGQMVPDLLRRSRPHLHFFHNHAGLPWRHPETLATIPCANIGV